MDDRSSFEGPEVTDGVPRDRRGIRLPRPCRSYASGHHAHPIQWSRARRDPATRAPAEIVAIGAESFTIEVEGGAVVARHHDLDRLAELVAWHGPRIDVQLAWHVLWIGDHLVSVRRSNPLDPCTTDEVGGAVVAATTAEETAERLRRVVRR